MATVESVQEVPVTTAQLPVRKRKQADEGVVDNSAVSGTPAPDNNSNKLQKTDGAKDTASAAKTIKRPFALSKGREIRLEQNRKRRRQFRS